MEPLKGYKCEFIDSIPEDFYCRSCSLVARRLTFTSCCGESFCHECIVTIQQEASSCPACSEESFNIYEQVKYQKRMGGLQVYCAMKDRGCEWSGTLDQLDTHLDPTQDQCRYVDIECPLKCLVVLTKIKLEDHLQKKCVKRDYVCQFCAYKANYEEVVVVHLPECKYVPLQCPNRCGVTCEREIMEDHLKTCRLQEVNCEFSTLGCEAKFKREDQDEHAAANVKCHLSLVAISSNDHDDLLEQLEEQAQKLAQQEKTIAEQKSDIQRLGRKLTELEQRLAISSFGRAPAQSPPPAPAVNAGLLASNHQLESLRDELHRLTLVIDPLKEFVLKRSFYMKDFTKEKEKDCTSEWKSPAMYTHVGGYKFCIGIDANGHGVSLGKAMILELWPLKGEYDYLLKWPADATFNIHIINQNDGPNWVGSSRISWGKPEQGDFYNFDNVKLRSQKVFIHHSKLKNYLSDQDTLFFNITNITLH